MKQKLSMADFWPSTTYKNVSLFFPQPLYGITPHEHIPFRLTSGGGRDLHFLEDKELELSEMVSQPIPRLPLQTAIKREILIFCYIL